VARVRRGPNLQMYFGLAGLFWQAPQDNGDDCYFGAVTDLLTNDFGYFGHDAVVATYGLGRGDGRSDLWIFGRLVGLVNLGIFPAKVATLLT